MAKARPPWRLEQPERGVTGRAAALMPFRDGVSDDLIEEQVEERSIVSAEEHSALEGVVLIALTALALIVGRVLHRNHVFGLPESGATILIGLVCGLCVHYISPIEAAYEQKLYFNPEFFNLFLLPPIIFESGFSLNQVRRDVAEMMSPRCRIEI